jgi:hypothetical protein
MAGSALVMTEEACNRIPDLLGKAGIRATSERPINEFRMLKCRRGWSAVWLGLSRPPHWEGDPVRGDKMVVAALTLFWRVLTLFSDRRLKHDVLDILRPHAWMAPP